MIPPQVRVATEKVWGQEWWKVEVTVLLGRGLPWFVKHGKEKDRAVAGHKALEQAIEYAQCNPPGPMSSGNSSGSGVLSQTPNSAVNQAHLTSKCKTLLAKLRVLCNKAGIKGEVLLRNAARQQKDGTSVGSVGSAGGDAGSVK